MAISYAPKLVPCSLEQLLPDRFGPHSLLRQGPTQLLLQPQSHNLEFTAGASPGCVSLSLHRQIWMQGSVGLTLALLCKLGSLALVHAGTCWGLDRVEACRSPATCRAAQPAGWPKQCLTAGHRQACWCCRGQGCARHY